MLLKWFLIKVYLMHKGEFNDEHIYSNGSWWRLGCLDKSQVGNTHTEILIPTIKEARNKYVFYYLYLVCGFHIYNRKRVGEIDIIHKMVIR